MQVDCFLDGGKMAMNLGFDRIARKYAGGYVVTRCERDELRTSAGKKAISRYEKGVGMLTSNSNKGRVNISGRASVEKKQF